MHERKRTCSRSNFWKLWTTRDAVPFRKSGEAPASNSRAITSAWPSDSQKTPASLSVEISRADACSRHGGGSAGAAGAGASASAGAAWPAECMGRTEAQPSGRRAASLPLAIVCNAWLATAARCGRGDAFAPAPNQHAAAGSTLVGTSTPRPVARR